MLSSKPCYVQLCSNVLLFENERTFIQNERNDQPLKKEASGGLQSTFFINFSIVIFRKTPDISSVADDINYKMLPKIVCGISVLPP